MVLFALLLIAIGVFVHSVEAADPLPSWNDGPVKRSIIEFINHVTQAGSPDFVAPEERIATFDNDGTLWSEQPAYFQLFFAMDRVKALAPEHPKWKTQQPFKAVLENDMKALATSGEKGLLELVMATHAGMTTTEFEQTVKDWVATAKHPLLKRPYTDLVFQPMLEVLAYLRANGFKNFIVSGGGIEFMRSVQASRQNLKCVMADPCSSDSLNLTLSTTKQANPSASTNTSAAVRLPPSAIPTAIYRCSSGPRPENVHDICSSSTIPMQSANGPMIVKPTLVAWTRRSTFTLFNSNRTLTRKMRLYTICCI
jgi:phosphoserine phosphatase